MATEFSLPLTLQGWPWPRQINPSFNECKEESDGWIRSFKAFSPRSQKAFDRCNFSLLASLAYPLLNSDGNRAGCDLMCLFFLIDEYTGFGSPDNAQVLCDNVKDALSNLHVPRPAGEWIGGEVARQFWERGVKTGTPSFKYRFIRTFSDYLDSVVEKAVDRNDNRVRDSLETYFEIRRKTIGALPAFTVLEIHMNIPDHIFTDPVVSRLVILTVDMIILCNDFCSYNVEQARGDDTHNLVRVFMDKHQTDIQGAVNHISTLHEELSREFLDLIDQVPKFGDSQVDLEVHTYIEGLANWVRANDCWSFESHRYFGSQGLEIQQTRIVELLPTDHSLGAKLPPKTLGGLLVEAVRSFPRYLFEAVFQVKGSQARDSRAVVTPAAIDIVV